MKYYYVLSNGYSYLNIVDVNIIASLNVNQEVNKAEWFTKKKEAQDRLEYYKRVLRDKKVSNKNVLNFDINKYSVYKLSIKEYKI